MMAVKERARSLQHRVRELEEENRALRVAVGLDDAQIEDQGTAGRVRRGELVSLPVGCLVFPIPNGWEFDGDTRTRPILWEERDGQRYLKVPIIKTEV